MPCCPPCWSYGRCDFQPCFVDVMASPMFPAFSVPFWFLVESPGMHDLTCQSDRCEDKNPCFFREFVMLNFHHICLEKCGWQGESCCLPSVWDVSFKSYRYGNLDVHPTSRVFFLLGYHLSYATVDGRNPAPVDMVNIPLFIGFHTSQVVQDFVHQP